VLSLLLILITHIIDTITIQLAATPTVCNLSQS